MGLQEVTRDCKRLKEGYRIDSESIFSKISPKSGNYQFSPKQLYQYTIKRIGFEN